jgi:phosphoribosylaminoimidazolecarboxamide formyltransferase/IMP cyclohydrolase
MQAAKGPFAILSVTDKTGLVPFARSLAELGYQILSTGGTAKLLQESGLSVTEVASFTTSDEFFNGRVKTLHPRIHGGILMDRDNPTHQEEAAKHHIEPIDLVVVNLYQFGEKAAAQNLSVDEAIEFIDIGGPTMLRAAAKNHRYCLPVIDPQDYDQIIAELQNGEVATATRQRLAAKVFATTSQYDGMIAHHLTAADTDQAAEDATTPEQVDLTLTLKQSLRYGENPQQKAGFYAAPGAQSGLQDAQVLQGKALSYNNYLDIDAAANLVKEFSQPMVAIIKHTNPCGAAQGRAGEPLAELYERALSGDPKSSFGGIVATNQAIDAATAEKMSGIFLECIAAPTFTDDAKAVFAKKKNLRLLELPYLQPEQNQAPDDWQLRSVRGGFLLQTQDASQASIDEWELATDYGMSNELRDDLWFSWRVAKHVKSNAIVLAKNLQTLTIGAGQMSRVDAVNFAITKALEEAKDLQGAVLASDAFFPFRDSIDHAARSGVKAVVQPGGSIRDEDSITACHEHELTMFLTGRRHFRH